MKPKSYWGILLGILLFTGACSTYSATSFIGKNAPTTRVIFLDGTSAPLEEFQGKYTVLLFWATTCRYSRTVIENLNAFAAKEGARRGIEVIAVSVDKQDAYPELLRRIEQQDLHAIRHAFSGNDIYDEAYIVFDVDTLPTVFVIDPRGKVVGAGYNEDVVEKVLG